MDLNTTTIACSLFEYRQPLATILAALLAAIVAPIIGLVVYFNQKEHELVRSRYLENGLDAVSANVEYAFDVFRHNWARGLDVLKHFRDMGSDMPKELYSKGFVELEPTSYKTAHSYLLKELTGDDIYHHVLQLLFSFVRNANALLMYDLCSTIRLSVEGGKEHNITSTRVEIVDAYFSRLNALNEKANSYYVIQAALHNLSFVLVRKRFTFKTIDKLRQHDVVRKTAGMLQQQFADDLKKYGLHEAA